MMTSNPRRSRCARNKTTILVHGVTIAAFICLSAAFAAQIGADPSRGELYLFTYLSNPINESLSDGVEGISMLKNSEQRQLAATQLRNAFVREWIEGKDRKGLTLAQFDTLARLCEPFGQNNEKLVEILAVPQVPAAWNNIELIRWLRTRLGSAGSAPLAPRFLETNMPPGADERVKKYAFLLEIVRDGEVEAIVQGFEKSVWNRAVPRDLPGFVSGLKAASQSPVEPSRFRLEPNRIRRLLADRLGEADVQDWPQAGDALLPVIQDSNHPCVDFLKKVCDVLRRKPAARTTEMAQVIQALVREALAKTSPRDAYKIVAITEDLNWFLWLHRAGYRSVLK